MDSKMQTSLLLILGSIVMFAAYMFIYPATPADSTQQQVRDLMADATIAKIGILLGYGGAIAIMLGLWNVSRSMLMAGGAGSSYANITFILLVALIAVMVTRTLIQFAVTGASGMPAGVLLVSVENALGVAMPLAMGIALGVLGLGIYFAKSFHVGVGAIAVIAGIINVVRPFVDNDSINFAGLVGLAVLALALGISRMRASA